MPFDIWISRCASWDEVQGREKGPRKQPGFLGRLLGGHRPSRITREEFRTVLAAGSASRRRDGSYWVRYPQTGEAWFSAQWRPGTAEGGEIVLSLSYSHPRFLRNWADAFDMALRFARVLHARVFEEAGGREVAQGNIDQLLDPKGRYVQVQRDLYTQVQERLGQRAEAPLEYPVGALDIVPEYFLFSLEPRNGAQLPPLSDLLGLLGPGLRVIVPQENGAGVGKPGEEQPSVQIGYSPEALKFRPFRGPRAFAEVAPTALAVADALAAANLGELRFLDRPLTPELRATLGQRSTGLGVEVFEWLQAPARAPQTP